MQHDYMCLGAAMALSLPLCSGCAPSARRHTTNSSQSDATTDDGDARVEGTPDDTGIDDILAPDEEDVCPSLQTAMFSAGAARSAGFAGTDAAYSALYGVPCRSAIDCVPACISAGATVASCQSSSECVAGEATEGGLGCLPPTYWRNVNGALSETGTTANAATLVLVSIPYDDPLVVTNFGISIPDEATVTGISFRVRRASDSGEAVDSIVQVLHGGVAAGTNHDQSEAWPGSLTYTTYGGASDLWGVSWTAADLRSSGFGLSIAPAYTGPSTGNAVRARPEVSHRASPPGACAFPGHDARAPGWGMS
jgi:hypothetical protein